MSKSLLSNTLTARLRHFYIFQKAQSNEIDDSNESSKSWLRILEERSHATEERGSFQFKNTDLSTLAGFLRKKKLNLFPEFQRSFVWDEAKASRLIATVIENRMVPAIVIHKSKGKLEVVDGKQRLCALLSFMMAASDKPLLEQIKVPVEKFEKLSGLVEEYDYLNGKSFADLPIDFQGRYEDFTISYAEIPENIPEETVFNIFSDINSGGVEMNAQQIRRASYYGEYIKRLDRLSSHEKFSKLFSPYTYSGQAENNSNKVKSEKEAVAVESDREAILRAMAFRKLWPDYKAPMKLFLNKELKRVNELPIESQQIELNKIEEEFKEVLDFATAIFEENTFQEWKYDKKIDTWKWDISFSQVDFDIIYCVIAELQAENKRKKLDYVKIKDSIVSIWKNIKQEKFTMSKSGFVKRRDLFKDKIKECWSSNLPMKDSTRNFTLTLKEKRELLHKQNGKCSLCSQTISETMLGENGYYETDHKIPHSRGGLTVIENAQLVHLSCNRSKKDKII